MNRRDLLIKFTYFLSQVPSQGAMTSVNVVNLNFSQGRYLNNRLREPFCTTWPDHFLKADDGPAVDRYFRAKCRRPSSRTYGPRTKKPKLEQEATGDVSPQSAEPTNTAESYSDSDTE